MNKMTRLLTRTALLFFSSSCIILPAEAQFEQTIQINTFFKSITGKPSWLLILRDEDSGAVIPYQYNIRNNEDFFIALAWDRNYRVTVSKLTFGPGPCGTINNFCNLEDGIIKGKSMIVRLRGHLTPNRYSSQCDVMKYPNTHFPIAG